MDLELVQKQYEITRINLQNALKQKNGLVNLVAGHSELKTLISMLNIIADANNIQILELTPQPIEFAAPRTPVQQQFPGNSITEKLDLDPLLVDEINLIFAV